MEADDAAKLPLRKEPARGGRLRLIDIEEFDLSACGGTHVSRTGGIGIIAIASWEKFRGGSRVEFLCGVRCRNIASCATRRPPRFGSSRCRRPTPRRHRALQAELRESKRTFKDAQAPRRSSEPPRSRRRRTVRCGWSSRALEAGMQRPQDDRVGNRRTAGSRRRAVRRSASDAGRDHARGRRSDRLRPAMLKRLTSTFGGKGERPTSLRAAAAGAPAIWSRRQTRSCARRSICTAASRASRRPRAASGSVDAAFGARGRPTARRPIGRQRRRRRSGRPPPGPQARSSAPRERRSPATRE